MPSIEQYQQSIAAEFEAQKDRVRYFIGDAHWGEDGRYKEILLADYLKSIMPVNVAVGTGFIRNASNELSHQIDIILYKKDFPCLFKKGDFVILMPECVLGILEVKSFLSASVLTYKDNDRDSVIERCENNGRIIGNKEIFNGIWGYDSNIQISPRIRNQKLGTQLSGCQGYLNHICFNSNLFCRYWDNGNPMDRYDDPRPCFSFYELSQKRIFEQDNAQHGLAFGYFISNLLEHIFCQVSPQVLNEQYFEILYPLESTKEMFRFSNCDIKIN